MSNKLTSPFPKKNPTSTLPPSTTIGNKQQQQQPHQSTTPIKSPSSRPIDGTTTIKPSSNQQEQGMKMNNGNSNTIPNNHHHSFNNTSNNSHSNNNLNKSLDEEIEYFSSPETSCIDMAPSPIKNDYRKDPEHSPSIFTKYPSPTLVQNYNSTPNKRKEEGEIYDNLFEDEDESKEEPNVIVVKSKSLPSFSVESSSSNQQQSVVEQEIFNSDLISTPTKRSSPFPKLNRSNVENFSTPNASKLVEKKSRSLESLTDISTMDLEQYEQFNVDNIITPIRESTKRQLSGLRNDEGGNLENQAVTKIEKKHQELFHHYLEEKGDLRNAMLLLNQFHMKQHKMNVLNFKLNSINLVANFANAVKSQKLQLELHKSKKAVANLNGKVEYLNETVEDLNNEVEQHKSSLSSFMQKYYKTVEELQQNQLVQKMQLDDIMRLKSREGVTVDLLILLAMSYLVRKSRVFHRFLRFIFMFLPFNGIVIFISKILATIGLMLLSRKAAVRLGIHAGATSVAYGLIQTLQFSFDTVRSIFKLLKIVGQSSLISPQTSREDDNH